MDAIGVIEICSKLLVPNVFVEGLMRAKEPLSLFQIPIFACCEKENKNKKWKMNEISVGYLYSNTRIN